MSSDTTEVRLLNRREAIRRVSILLGGVAFVGGSSLLTACERVSDGITGTPGKFSVEDIAFLDEIAETILPETKTPGAKAAKTGAFMGLMVTDVYSPDDQRVFRDGMRKVDEETRKAHGVGFMAATPAQRLAVLTVLDREQKVEMDRREAEDRKKRGLAPVRGGSGQPTGDAYLPDQRKENAPATDANPAAAVTGSPPAHYFRMMKELALLGYFTSEIGYTRAMRYEETPGRFDPCAPYTPGETSWAPHA